MVERTPHPGPLPIGSADSADAEREKRSQRLGGVLSRVVQGFNTRNFREILILAFSPGRRESPFPRLVNLSAFTFARGAGGLCANFYGKSSP